ncbi:hydroxymethylpyrimidine/phosphomethylpyrimidine kinase [Bizionia gelidisalsuginis]|uniref:hydroxymethylpyrimidine kinase n=2 Tax=Bizionia TaxID=283785 RepID=A0A8H2QG91_9FLAO|nr:MULTISPECIES: hydroxymethylpyrimidine/phosphomethylpyrimidine kinase [Bizionia]TYB78015.1 hydroxymethylpyrimidine/phosphomethylpyrimidine kinase [Bizionia saleffrena]TYC12681.1 hydroxymethylpyrimidine/phosphomethylpyrimidine kinase [Bizionia gelidisalsuginis]
MTQKPYILSIAGFDPSSGAGITSDIKTFEVHNLYGLSVCTAVTIQNDTTFKDCIWMDSAVIISQIEILFERFTISVVKIGIVKSWEVLHDITKTLKRLNPEIKIILDPILKASAGYHFHDSSNLETLSEILNSCYFITPNYEEIHALFPDKTIEDTISYISEKTNIYLKGGHRKDKIGWDEVYYNKIVQLNIPPTATSIHQKHGSGCVLSAALASNTVKNMVLEDACKLAKLYTEAFLNSNTSLLGTHNYNFND